MPLVIHFCLGLTSTLDKVSCADVYNILMNISWRFYS